MAEGTKLKILDVALQLFSQNGYLGTSMNDIAMQLGITKPALYKHYTSKHEILECIAERMNEMDFERAKEYEMPETQPDGFADAYVKTPVEKIRAYSMAQFRYWTEEEFPAQFRKMLTLEQYRDAEMANLYQNYIATGPVEYMAAIFRKMTDSDGKLCSWHWTFTDRCFCYTVYMTGQKTRKLFLNYSGNISTDLFQT